MLSLCFKYISVWSSKERRVLVKQDYIIRKYIEQFFESYGLLVGEVRIFRTHKRLFLNFIFGDLISQNIASLFKIGLKTSNGFLNFKHCIRNNGLLPLGWKFVYLAANKKEESVCIVRKYNKGSNPSKGFLKTLVHKVPSHRHKVKMRSYIVSFKENLRNALRLKSLGTYLPVNRVRASFFFRYRYVRLNTCLRSYGWGLKLRKSADETLKFFSAWWHLLNFASLPVLRTSWELNQFIKILNENILNIGGAVMGSLTGNRLELFLNTRIGLQSLVCMNQYASSLCFLSSTRKVLRLIGPNKKMFEFYQMWWKQSALLRSMQQMSNQNVFVVAHTDCLDNLYRSLETISQCQVFLNCYNVESLNNKSSFFKLPIWFSFSSEIYTFKLLGLSIGVLSVDNPDVLLLLRAIAWFFKASHKLVKLLRFLEALFLHLVKFTRVKRKLQGVRFMVRGKLSKGPRKQRCCILVGRISRQTVSGVQVNAASKIRTKRGMFGFLLTFGFGQRSSLVLAKKLQKKVEDAQIFVHRLN